MDKELTATLGLALLICGLVFAGSEAAVRLLSLAPRSRITLDSCTGFKLEPGSRGYVPGPAGLVPVSANSDGFRDVEHATAKKSGVYRVLFLGDSFTEATQVPIEQTFWRQLQTLADQGGLPIEVMSLGLSSFGTGQEMLSYECYGKRYDPDLVVLDFVNAHDLIDNYFRTDPFAPSFSIVGDSLVLDTAYQANITKRLRERGTLFPGVLYWIKDHSALVRYLYTKWQNARAGQELGNKVGSAVFLEEYAKTYTPEWEEAWGLTGAIIERLAHDVRADGGQLAIMQVPSLEQLEPELVENPDQYDFSKSSTYMKAIAVRSRVPVIDLLPILTGAQKEGVVHWPNDMHLDVRGHTVVSKALYTILSSLITGGGNLSF